MTLKVSGDSRRQNQDISRLWRLRFNHNPQKFVGAGRGDMNRCGQRGADDKMAGQNFRNGSGINRRRDIKDKSSSSQEKIGKYRLAAMLMSECSEVCGQRAGHINGDKITKFSGQTRRNGSGIKSRTSNSKRKQVTGAEEKKREPRRDVYETLFKYLWASGHLRSKHRTNGESLTKFRGQNVRNGLGTNGRISNWK
jgi:hypothetical protein